MKISEKFLKDLLCNHTINYIISPNQDGNWNLESDVTTSKCVKCSRIFDKEELLQRIVDKKLKETETLFISGGKL